MLVRAFGVGARRVMQCGNAQATVLVVAYDDDRRGVVSLAPGHPFGITLGAPGRDAVTLDPLDGFFEAFMDELLGFFTTGRSTSLLTPMIATSGWLITGVVTMPPSAPSEVMVMVEPESSSFVALLLRTAAARRETSMALSQISRASA